MSLLHGSAIDGQTQHCNQSVFGTLRMRVVNSSLWLASLSLVYTVHADFGSLKSFRGRGLLPCCSTAGHILLGWQLALQL